MARSGRSSQAFPDFDSQTLKHRRVVRLKFIPLLDWHRAIPRAMKTIRIGYWKSSSSAPINNCQTCVSSPHRSSTNTNRRPLMSESYSLPTEPEGVIPSLIERFNSGKVSAMETLYEGAVLIADDGRTVTDRAEIAAELERDLSLGLPLEAKARHVFVNGDIAQIVVDWSIDGTGPDGEHVHVEGTASDVARRGADGRWRYLIDNRLGTAVRQPA